MIFAYKNLFTFIIEIKKKVSKQTNKQTNKKK